MGWAGRRVTYHLDNWDLTTPELMVEGWPVTLVGSATLEATNTVVVTGTDQDRKRLLVVPPGTPGGVARAVLRLAAAPETVASAGGQPSRRRRAASSPRARSAVRGSHSTS